MLHFEMTYVLCGLFHSCIVSSVERNFPGKQMALFVVVLVVCLFFLRQGFPGAPAGLELTV